MFTTTYQIWKNKASPKAEFITNAGLNNDQQKNELLALNPNDPNLNAFALGDDIKGVPTANYKLLQAFEFKDDDIIIIGADDFHCPKNWDLIIRDCFENYDGSVIFEDGNPEKMRPIVTLPILTGRLLKKLNGIVYHPAYKHNYADNEFFLNVTELGEVVDLRPTKPEIVFEHRHWLFSKRPRDAVDTFAVTEESNDHKTWDYRKTLPIAERLKV